MTDDTNTKALGTPDREDAAVPGMAGHQSPGALGRRAGYRAATLLVSAELITGGIWDVLRISQVRDVVEQLGYPSYFLVILVILGTWKLLGAVALLAPRFALLKEWAYAGVVFADTGAIVSHLVVGYDLGEVAFLVPLLGLTCLSWALRPASRRVARQTATGRVS